MSAAIADYSATLLLVHQKLFKGMFSATERASIYSDAKELLFNNKVPPVDSKLCAKTHVELESRYPELTSYLITGKLTSVRWC